MPTAQEAGLLSPCTSAFTSTDVSPDLCTPNTGSQFAQGGIHGAEVLGRYCGGAAVIEMPDRKDTDNVATQLYHYD